MAWVVGGGSLTSLTVACHLLRPSSRTSLQAAIGIAAASSAAGPQGLDFVISVGLRFCGWVCVPPMGGI